MHYKWKESDIVVGQKFVFGNSPETGIIEQLLTADDINNTYVIRNTKSPITTNSMSRQDAKNFLTNMECIPVDE